MKPAGMPLSSADIPGSGSLPVPTEKATIVSETPDCRDGSSSASAASNSQPPSQPVMKTRPGNTLASWTEMMPQEIRLLTLSALGRQRDAELLERDLASYACVSKAAQEDVRDFHKIFRDPRVSLLASRHLVCNSWGLARTRSLFFRSDCFKTVLKTAAAIYSAVTVDGRLGCEENRSFADVANTALEALLQTEITHIHLRLGHPDIDFDGSNHAADHNDALVLITTLINGSLQRLRQGKPAPSAFLQIQGLTPNQLAERLAESPITLDITGLSLCSDRRHVDGDLNNHSSPVWEPFGLKRQPCQRYALLRESWDVLFLQLKKIKYLDLTGWGGASLSDSLTDFIAKGARLEALHLSNCQLESSDFRRLIRTIQKRACLKVFAIDKIKPALTPGAQRSLLQLLDALPEIRVIMGVDQPLAVRQRFARYGDEGRVVYEDCSQTMRDLPEIYSGVDLFKPAT